MEAWADTVCSVCEDSGCQILPCVLYGAEIRELKEVPEIERVHAFAQKSYLNVASQTPNTRIKAKQGTVPCLPPLP